MYSQRECHPLILFDSAIVVCVKISKAALLVKWVLLDVHTRGINVGSQYIHTLFEFFLSYIEHRYSLVHPDRIHFVASLKLLFVLDYLLEIFVTVFLSLTDYLLDTFSLSLAIVKKFPVVFAETLKFLYLFFLVLTPCIFLCHISYLL